MRSFTLLRVAGQYFIHVAILQILLWVQILATIWIVGENMSGFLLN